MVMKKRMTMTKSETITKSDRTTSFSLPSFIVVTIEGEVWAGDTWDSGDNFDGGGGRRRSRGMWDWTDEAEWRGGN